MERDARVVSLLEDNVRTELQVANDMLELGLSAAAIEGLMEGVTSGLLYAFAVDWSPDCVKPGLMDQGAPPARKGPAAGGAGAPSSPGGPVLRLGQRSPSDRASFPTSRQMGDPNARECRLGAGLT
jgi:hypothetical protein